MNLQKNKSEIIIISMYAINMIGLFIAWIYDVGFQYFTISLSIYIIVLIIIAIDYYLFSKKLKELELEMEL